MKKLFLYGGVISVIVVLSGCASVPNLITEPSVSFDSVSFNKISFDSVDMTAKLIVVNGNPVSIPFPQLDWELFVADNGFLKGEIHNTSKLSANSATPVEIPFSVPYKELYAVFSNLLDADEVPYKVAVDARFPLPLLDKKVFSSDVSGSLPMLKAPSLSFAGVQFKTFNPAKVEFVLTWVAENKNAFPVNIDKLRYDFSAGGASWASGSAPSKLALPPRKTTQIPVTVSLNSLSAVKDIIAIAGNKKNADFVCSGEAELAPEFEGLVPFKMPFNFTGTTELGK